MNKYICSFCNSNIADIIPNVSDPESKYTIVRCYECNKLSFYGDEDD
jgi:DNA-directed RNA polymerase subunit RPC12/RpoP